MADSRKPPGPDSPQRKVQVDDRGRSVWVDPVRTAEFELVSTQTLQALLDADDDQSRGEFERIAGDAHDGVLARESATGHFRVIDDDALQAILDEQSDGPMSTNRIGDTVKLVRLPTGELAGDDGGEEELSLVSTQALRKILHDVDDDKPQPGKKTRRDEGGGFDPYDTG